MLSLSRERTKPDERILDRTRKQNGIAACNLTTFATRQPQALQLNQAASRGGGNSFSPADDVHLREYGFHVRLHGAFTDE